MAERSATRWLIPVGLALLIGLLLAILSVPAAAFASQRWGAFSSGSSMIGDLHRIPDAGGDGGTEDGVYFLTEHRQPAATTRTPPSTTHTITTSDRRGVLMRLRASTRAASPYADQFLEGPSALEPHATDPRPAFLRSPPPAGYTTVEGVSAGWPWHAAYGLRFRGRGQPDLQSGLIDLPLGRAGDVLPWRPLWGGLAGNALVYATLVLAAFAAFRLARSIRRRKRGQCPACGYPLDGDMERCPECGVPNEHRLVAPTLANPPRRAPPMPPIGG